jgi:uncharacterized protein YbaP (TraB family)
MKSAPFQRDSDGLGARIQTEPVKRRGCSLDSPLRGNDRRVGSRRRAVAATLVLLLSPTPSFADDPPACHGRDLSELATARPDALKSAEKARADWLVNAKGLLWRLEKPGVAPSYLFGTIHSSDDRAITLAHKAAEHVKDVKVVATELGGPIDKTTMAEFGAKLLVKALAKDKDTFEPIAASDRAAVEQYVGARGLNAELAHPIDLGFLTATAAAPLCEALRQAADLPIVDNVIAETAKNLGVKVEALETFEEQGATLAALKPSDAATILVSGAKKPGLDEDAYATLLDLYVAGRPVEAMPILDASGLLSQEEIAAEGSFSLLLLRERNRVMAERAKPLMAAGGAFIAVGAFHLAGKDGLVSLFREQGWTATPLW